MISNLAVQAYSPAGGFGMPSLRERASVRVPVSTGVVCPNADLLGFDGTGASAWGAIATVAGTFPGSLAWSPPS